MPSKKLENRVRVKNDQQRTNNTRQTPGQSGKARIDLNGSTVITRHHRIGSRTSFRSWLMMTKRRRRRCHIGPIKLNLRDQKNQKYCVRTRTCDGCTYQIAYSIALSLPTRHEHINFLKRRIQQVCQNCHKTDFQATS